MDKKSSQDLRPVGATGISPNLNRFPYTDLDLDVDLDLDLDVPVSDTAQRSARLPEMASAGAMKQTVAW